MPTKKNKIHTRSTPTINRQSRSLSLRLSADGNGPITLDAKTRSLDVICATENRVKVMDWDTWEPIDEILLMSGCTIPDNRQVPLLDTHDRYSTASVIGSCRSLAVVGSELIGRAHFADDPAVESAWSETRDGHITDFSVGYSIDQMLMVPDGQSASFDGRTFDGPVRIATAWTVKELSVCPIGADSAAKARAERQTAASIPPAGPTTTTLAGKPEPLKKDDAMDKRLRAFLESRGLPKDATEEQAYEYLATIDTREANPDTGIRSAIADERERFAEISAMGQRFDCQDLAVEMIRSGDSIDAARAKVLEHVATKKTDPDPGFRVSVGADERDKFRAAAEDALCLRAGIKVATPAQGAADLSGYSLREMARHSLTLANQPTGGNVMEMLGRSLVTGDLPNILANVANKSLFAGYETAPETWATWCDTGSVPDFKTNTLASISEFSDLDQVVEGQKYNYGDMSDAKETFAIATYGKLFAITRQTLINDDLAALTDIPMKHGEAAARKVGDIAYAVLTANAAMRDGIALFHASHGNLGTTGAVSGTTVGEAIKLMKLQKDLQGLRRLNIRAEYLIAPVTIEGAAEIFFSSQMFDTALTSATRNNPYAGPRFTRVYDARLDDSSASVYYFAGPKGKTVKVFFLNGQQAPYLETRQGWSVDGVEYKVRIDAGAKAVDWKAMVKIP